MKSFKCPVSAAFGSEQASWLFALREKGTAESTIECYRRDLRDASAGLESITGIKPTAGDLSRVGPADINHLQMKWTEQGVAPSTSARRISALRGFAAHLIKVFHINCSALLLSPIPEVRRKLRDPFDAVTAEALISTPVKFRRSWIELRNHAIFSFVAATGVTCCELAAIKRSRVRAGTHAVWVEGGHLRPRWVILTGPASNSLLAYLLSVPWNCRLEDPLFLTRDGNPMTSRAVEKAVSQVAMTAGTVGNVMALRHALGQALAVQTREPTIVARALGTSLEAVFRYFG